MDTTYTQRLATPRQVLTRDPPRTAARSDAEVIAASIGDTQAFTELFERHWQELQRFCHSRAGSAGEDIASEAFRVAFDRRHKYDGRYRDARPWLFGIATNLLRDHFREAQREERKRSRSAALETLGHADNDLSELERQLLGPRLTSALQDLPAADRDALLLLAWADLDYQQIALALGIPLGTVRSRIHRARRRVRAYLDSTHTPDETTGGFRNA
jgi:RNA polymerase sigma factor (sigma-70 family)